MTVPLQQPALLPQSLILRPTEDCAFLEEPPADLMQRLLDAAKTRKKAGHHVLRQDRLVLSDPHPPAPMAAFSSKTNSKCAFPVPVSTPSTSRSSSAASGSSMGDFFGVSRHTSIDHTRLAKRNQNHLLTAASSSSSIMTAATTTSPPSSTAHSCSTYFSCSSVL